MDRGRSRRRCNIILNRINNLLRELFRTLIAGFSVLALVLGAHGQVNVTTYHNDNARTGQNTNETILNPANVNVNQFGKLFTQPVDGMIVGQPLYLSNVVIPGAGTHNVVYVATQHDSVYAFDADNNQGANAAPLWLTSFINPSAGITSVPIADQACSNVTRFTEIGIVATPVIDLATGTLYVIVKTEENGKFVHRLHALDVATGQEKLGGPVIITASVSVNNQVVNFDDRHQMARPALLLANGVVYIAFGSVGCISFAPFQGWVLAYDATTLRQLGVYNAVPDQNAGGAIWQAGAGPASDGSNIYVVTSDGVFNGNPDFGDSMLKLKLTQQGLSLIDYFTPFNQSYLQTADLDLGSSGALLLPDQTGAHRHLLLSGGKEGTTYLVDRDNMGQFNPNSDQVVQTLPSTGAKQRGVSTYWNNQVYIAPSIQFISGYQLSGGQLSTQPVSQATVQFTPGIPSISAKGLTQGILWVVRIGTTTALYAFDASNLSNNLYNSLQSSPRDDLGPVAHFSVPTVANGKVYAGGVQQLTVYGLYRALSAVGGNNQSARVATSLPTALRVLAVDSSGPIAGVPITFKDGGKGGTFTKGFVRTDSTGIASTNYTVPTKSGIFIITASSPGFAKAMFTVTATPGTATTLVARFGAGQSAPVTSTLLSPIVAKALDVYGNAVPGVPINFVDKPLGGSFSPVSVNTDSTGKASSAYTTSTKAGAVIVKALSTGITPVSFPETVTAGSVFTIALSAGNNQSSQAGTQFSQALVVTLTDQYGNLVPGAPVTFSDNSAGGSFSANPVTSDGAGRATVNYTAPTKAGSVSVTGSAGGVSSPSFTENVSAAPFSTLTLTSGNNQTTQAGTPFSQKLVVICTDQYGNALSGISVTFSDGPANGSFSANPVSSDSNGRATVNYTAPTKTGNVSVTASAGGVSSGSFSEAVIAASASALNIISGNNQSGTAGSTLATRLVVQVTDVYGNSVSGTPVTFGDNSSGGNFSTNPIGSNTS
ncbi:MAG: hypothetical protein DMG86_07955, partial [Acidobacteria bacterium]